MAGTPNRLSALKVKSASIGDVLRDGGGLQMVRTKGGAVWSFHYTSKVTRTRREMGLGELSLTAARARAEDIRADIGKGIDPLEARAKAEQRQRDEREAERVRAEAAQRVAVIEQHTLRKMADIVHRELLPTFKNKKHGQQWWRSLEQHAGKLWNMPCRDITARDVLDVLMPLYQSKGETASRVRQRCEEVLNRAIVAGYADNNPFLVVRKILAKAKSASGHFRSLPYPGIPALVVALIASEDIGLSVKLALLFTIATAGRSGEIRGATWAEIDVKARTWKIPGTRMKKGLEHNVHLSAFALDVLKLAEPLRNAKHGGDALVFPAPRTDSKPLSDMSLTMPLRRLLTGALGADGKPLLNEKGKPQSYGDIATAHGFRSGFYSWAIESAKARRDVADLALAHVEGNKTRAAYLDVDLLDERAALLDKWGAFISSKPVKAKVLPIHRKRA